MFAVAAPYHAVHGLALALRRLGLRARGGSRAVPGLVAVGAALLVLGVAGFAGAFEAVRERAIAGDYARTLESLGLADRGALR